MSDEEYEALSRADQEATKLLRRTTKDPRFRRLDTEEQKRYIEGVYSKARGQAKDRLWSRRDLRRRASQQLREARG